MLKIPAIVRELIAVTPHIAELIAAGERQAEMERIRWEEQKRSWERERAEEAARKARKESREDLFEIIRTWNEAKQVEAFFADAESKLCELDSDRLQLIASRLSQARALIGSIDALTRFQAWKVPEER
jgi:GTP1/Obg family GTP-binding protein